MKKKGSFSSLNPKAKIFEEIKIHKPNWWRLFCGDKELYIDIRKDNYINVYFYGGSVVKIDYKNDFVAKTHQKYLGFDKPLGKTKEGKEKFIYMPLDLTKINEKLIADIKNRINCDYLRLTKKVNPAEKWIQGKMIAESSNYIDSEFQFNDPQKKNDKLRIDLIEFSDGLLTLVELKGITDSRLRNYDSQKYGEPEIIKQMGKYENFIKGKEPDIKGYYKKLIGIKQDLGLITFDKTEFSLNKKPKLVIANTYKKMTKGKEERIRDIKRLLENNNIDYVIIKWK
jgi:hypothetical protein